MEKSESKIKEPRDSRGIDSTGMVFKGMQDFLPAFADFSRGSPYDFTHVALTLPLGGVGGEVLGLLQTEHSGIGFNPFVNASHTDAERHYFGKDHLGSIRAVTNQWGSPLYMFDYDVFGTPLQDRPERFRHGFTGKEFDSWTGLYNYGFRDYASLYGRFTTVDPIQDGHNWYAYVNSDPVNWLDPWGLECPDQESGGDPARYTNSGGVFTESTVDFMKYTMGGSFWGEMNKTRIKISNHERGWSLPFFGVSIPNSSDIYQGGYNPDETKNKQSMVGKIGLESHEIFHQYQYNHDALAFFKLAAEQVGYSLNLSDPYKEGDRIENEGILDKIQKLEDIKTLEGQAQFVGQWNADVYAFLTGREIDVSTLKKEALIILNSGFKSFAASEILLMNGGNSRI